MHSKTLIFVLCVISAVTVESGPAPPISRLQVIHSGCANRNPVIYYIQLGYATTPTVTWNNSDARRKCKDVHTYLTAGRIVIGWIYKCTFTSPCSGNFNVKGRGIRNRLISDRRFQNCC